MSPKSEIYDSRIRACILNATLAQSPELEKLWLSIAESYQHLCALDTTLKLDRAAAPPLLGADRR